MGRSDHDYLLRNSSCLIDLLRLAWWDGYDEESLLCVVSQVLIRQEGSSRACSRPRSDLWMLVVYSMLGAGAGGLAESR